jgi:hypothetical protein
MTTTNGMLAIDLAKGTFKVCAVGPEGGLYHCVFGQTAGDTFPGLGFAKL